MPGGKLEPGESPEDCLTRELAEEFSIETYVGRYLGESVYDYGEKVIQLKAYQVTHFKGEFMLNEFVDRFGPRMAHLNGLLQVLSQLSSVASPTNTPNSP